MRGNFKKLAKGFPNEVGRALYVETEIEATEAKRLCPVDTGELRGSIFVAGPFSDGNKVLTMIVCGGPAAPYAIYVHEDLTKHHPTGEAKFIEKPLMESAPYMGERVAARIDLMRAQESD